MICATCNHTLSDTDHVCPVCGAPVPSGLAGMQVTQNINSVTDGGVVIGELRGGQTFVGGIHDHELPVAPLPPIDPDEAARRLDALPTDKLPAPGDLLPGSRLHHMSRNPLRLRSCIATR